MTVFTASAPGKLMLFGEYAVLEGHPAAALCFSARMRCSLRPLSEPLLVVDSPAVLPAPVSVPLAELDLAVPAHPHLALIWRLLEDHSSLLRPDGPGLSLEIDAGFPPTWGLGSSSASTLVVAACLRALAGDDLRRSPLFGAVRDAVRAVQGPASGYDIAAQLLGGCSLFQDDGVARFEIIAPGADLSWLVGYTGSKASTAAMIRRVRELHPPGAPIYGRIGALASRGIERLRAGDAEGLGAAMNEGHGLLAELGAVPEERATTLRSLQRQPAVHGARMCGAGGGDCVLVLAADEDAARAAMRTEGLEVLDLTLDPRGLELGTDPTPSPGGRP